MHENVLKQLYEPFELKARRGVGNQTFKYVPSDDIIDRMNKVFKGNWETTVISAERFENDVIVHVRVSATDHDTGKSYSHDGFSSHMIARYTSGHNQGQAIDIGNSYKSALSKAIKNAVAKWGVGLYLESQGFEEDPSPMPNNTPPVKTPSNNTPAGPPIDGPPMGGTPSGPSPKPVAPTGTPVGPTFQPPMTPPVGSPSGNPVSEPPAMPRPETPPDAPVFTKDVPAGTNQAPPNEPFSAPTESSETGASDVQMKAIIHITKLNDIGYEKLAGLALGTENPPAVEKLTYIQARTIIQYGNNLNATS